MNKCKGLPPKIEITAFKNQQDYELYICQSLYGDFVSGGTFFCRKKIILDMNRISHLYTSGDKVEAKRKLDTERARRTGWIKPVIEGNICKNCTARLKWVCENEKGKKTKILCTKEEYLIILNEKRTCYFISTAYKLRPSEKPRVLGEYNRQKRP